MDYLIIFLPFLLNAVQADDCMLDEPDPDCYGYCYASVKPVLSYIPTMQKRLEACEALKQSYATEKLQHMESLLIQQLELTKSLKQDYSISFKDCNQNTKGEQTQHDRKRFRKIGYKYYYIENSEKLTWIGALQKCSKWGAHLASLQSQLEFNMLKTILHSEKSYWIDLNDIENKGEFISATTGTTGMFVKWLRGEPNNGGIPQKIQSEDCVEMKLKPTYGMNDCKCGYTRHFICESETEI